MKSRFYRTKLGTIWVLISNLLSIGILSVVYTKIFPNPNPTEYIIYMATGFCIWTAMSSVIVSASSVFMYHAGNVHNTSTNKFFYIFEELWFQCINMIIGTMPILLSLTLVSAVMQMAEFSILNIIVNGCLFWALIVSFYYVVIIVMSTVCIVFRDFEQIVTAILQLSFLTSPIMFPANALGRYEKYSAMNPLYLMVKLTRNMITRPFSDINLSWIIAIICTCIILCTIATLLFEKFSKKIVFYV